MPLRPNIAAHLVRQETLILPKPPGRVHSSLGLQCKSTGVLVLEIVSLVHQLLVSHIVLQPQLLYKLCRKFVIVCCAAVKILQVVSYSTTFLSCSWFIHSYWDLIEVSRGLTEVNLNVTLTFLH